MGLKKFFRLRKKTGVVNKKNVRIIEPTRRNVVTYNADEPVESFTYSRSRRLLELSVNSIAIVVSALATIVFLIPFAHGLEKHSQLIAVNSALLFTSGLIINLGSIIQIFSILLYGHNRLDGNYTKCLAVGCFTLLTCQLFTYTHEGTNNVSYLMTILTTLLSCTCTMIMYLLTTDIYGFSLREMINEMRDSRRTYTVNTVYAPTTIPMSVEDPKYDIVFLEGTCCLGKTTVSDHTFDFTQYIENFGPYAMKHQLPHIASLYEAVVGADIVNFLRDYTDGDKICDRMMFSQLAYALVFHYKGHKRDPKEFAADVDREFFNDSETVQEVGRVFNKWMKIFNGMVPNATVRVVWLIAKNVDLTVKHIEERACSEDLLNWNLRNYVENQNTVFSRLASIVDVERNYSSVKFVDDFLTADSIAQHIDAVKRNVIRPFPENGIMCPYNPCFSGVAVPGSDNQEKAEKKNRIIQIE